MMHITAHEKESVLTLFEGYLVLNISFASGFQSLKLTTPKGRHAVVCENVEMVIDFLCAVTLEASY